MFHGCIPPLMWMITVNTTTDLMLGIILVDDQVRERRVL